MPPGPAFNWFSVAYSAVQILEHAAQYRAAQLTRTGAGTASRKRRRLEEIEEEVELEVEEDLESRDVQPSSLHRANEAWLKQIAVSPPAFLPNAFSNVRHIRDTEALSPRQVEEPPPLSDAFNTSVLPSTPTPDIPPSIPTFAPRPSTPLSLDPSPQHLAPELPIARTLQSSKVPSSRIGRLFHYGGLAASLGYGAASELVRRSTTSSGSSTPVMFTEANISRLVNKLSQMRGAALKVGQFLSIQDTHLLPPEVDKIFRRVQDGAHYMPNWQMEA
ncbi:hypothetical protein OF83DRAFT_1178206 [Amylostereum chailletii]|nr:hypothetical protein OF83DRAFT_1178206 [Amylostereum chailletii]